MSSRPNPRISNSFPNLCNYMNKRLIVFRLAFLSIQCSNSVTIFYCWIIYKLCMSITCSVFEGVASSFTSINGPRQRRYNVRKSHLGVSTDNKTNWTLFLQVLFCTMLSKKFKFLTKLFVAKVLNTFAYFDTWLVNQPFFASFARGMITLILAHLIQDSISHKHTSPWER